jgi:hypothetical protein
MMALLDITPNYSGSRSLTDTASLNKVYTVSIKNTQPRTIQVHYFNGKTNTPDRMEFHDAHIQFELHYRPETAPEFFRLLVIKDDYEKEVMQVQVESGSGQYNTTLEVFKNDPSGKWFTIPLVTHLY